MKKITIFLAAVLCVFGLTACGEEKALTAYEQQKVESAEGLAVRWVLPVMGMVMDGSFDNNPWDEYTMEEVGDAAEYFFYYVSNGQNTVEVDGYGFYNAMSSFKKAKDEMGYMVSVDGVQSRIDDDQIIVTVDVMGEKRAGQAEIIFSNDGFMRLQSASLNPNYSFKEKMSKAGLNTALGMGTVFIVLILISLIISLFGIIPKIQKNAAERKAKKEAEKNVAANGIENAVAQIIETETAAEDADDTELVAVIAAAIAAYEGSSTDGFVVRSIKKINR